MRVLTVGNMYPPHHYGGYELVWRSAVEHLRERGHQVRVVTTDTRTQAREPDSPAVFRELRWALRDARFDPLSHRERVAVARHNHRVLDRHLSELSPDVVGWWSMGGLTLTMLETVRRAGLPAVAFVHDDWLDYGLWADQWLGLFRDRRAVAAPAAERLVGFPARVDFDGVGRWLFGSERTRRHAASCGHRLTHTGVAQLGIDPVFLDPEPTHEWRWRLLYVGRLDPRKGIDTAIEAMPSLPEATTLEVIGAWDTGEEARLRELVASRGLSARVDFGGQRGRHEIADAYARCDVALFPVRWEEPWGLVPLEAMAKGRPVVATGRGGSGEYLRDGENCLLFQADNVESLAGAVRRLADEPDLRARVREHGLATAGLYTEPIYNEKVERALTQAVG